MPSAYISVEEDSKQRKDSEKSSHRNSIHQPDDVLQRLERDSYNQKHRSKSQITLQRESVHTSSARNASQIDEDEYIKKLEGNTKLIK